MSSEALPAGGPGQTLEPTLRASRASAETSEGSLR